MSETTTTTTAAENPENLRLEREPCSRCGGSGHYSYCQMYGTRCFRCHGAKEVLTKRGAAAAAYLQGLRSRKASELKVGDRVHFEGLVVPGAVCERPRWTTVERVEKHDFAKHGGSIVNGRPLEGDWLQIYTGACTYSQVSPDSKFRVYLGKEGELEALRQAIAYQATLTKAGTPRKR